MANKSFHPKNLLSVRYLAARLKTLESFDDLSYRLINLVLLLAATVNWRRHKKRLERRRAQLQAFASALLAGRAPAGKDPLPAQAPRTARAHYKLAAAHRERGEFAQSVTEYRAVLTLLDRGRPRSLLNKYIFNNTVSAMAEICEHIISCAAAARGAEGNLPETAGDYIAAACQLPADFTGTWEYHRFLGRIFIHLGEQARSLEHFAKALALAPDEDAQYKNILLCERDFALKNTVLEAKPQGLIVTLTNRCNLRCKMCAQYKEPCELPAKTIREIRELLPCLVEITWLGGEVFLADSFRELFTYAARFKKLRQTILTNGLLIDAAWARLLTSASATIRYSLDGVTKDTYEKIRTGAAFEDLLKSVALINEHRHKNRKGTRTEICFTVMKSNYPELEPAMDFAAEQGFSAIAFNPVMGFNDEEDIFNRPDERARAYFQNILPKLREKAGKYAIDLSYNLPALGSSPRGSAPPPVAARQSGAGCLFNPAGRRLFCHLPWKHLRISGNKAQFDCYCLRAVGNVEENSLEEIWNNGVAREYRKKILAGSLDWCSDACKAGTVPQISNF